MVSQVMLRSENLRGVKNFVCSSCAREGDGCDDNGDDKVPG